MVECLFPYVWGDALIDLLIRLLMGVSDAVGKWSAIRNEGADKDQSADARWIGGGRERQPLRKGKFSSPSGTPISFFR